MKIRFYHLLAAVMLLLLNACQESPQPPGKSDPMPGIAFVSIHEDNWDLYKIQPDGSGLVRLTDSPEVDSEPAWSPDGTQIAFRSRRDGSSDIFIMGADGSSPVNLINDPADSFNDEFYPNFQPGGDLLAIYTDRPPFADECRIGGVHQLALMSITGGKESIYHAGIIPGEQESNAWSPDGRFLVFSSICRGKAMQLYMWQQATDELTQLTDEEFTSFSPAFSPDGHWLAFTSGRSGNSDIWMMHLGSREWRQVTTSPARDYHPSWSPDGTQIVFTSNRDGNDEIYIINVDGSNPVNLTNNPDKDFWPDWSPVE